MLIYIQIEIELYNIGNGHQIGVIDKFGEDVWERVNFIDGLFLPVV